MSTYRDGQATSIRFAGHPMLGSCQSVSGLGTSHNEKNPHDAHKDRCSEVREVPHGRTTVKEDESSADCSEERSNLNESEQRASRVKRNPEKQRAYEPEGQDQNQNHHIHLPMVVYFRAVSCLLPGRQDEPEFKTSWRWKRVDHSTHEQLSEQGLTCDKSIPLEDEKVVGIDNSARCAIKMIAKSGGDGYGSSMTYIRQLRANIVAELSKNEMRQTEAARLIGLPQASFAGRLKGRTPFRINELLILSKVLNTDIGVLLHDVEAEFRANPSDELEVS